MVGPPGSNENGVGTSLLLPAWQGRTGAAMAALQYIHFTKHLLCKKPLLFNFGTLTP
jgi:hypothetical protein